MNRNRANGIFPGNRDFVEFVKEAQKAGLWVIVRPVPMCVEWEFGGFPDGCSRMKT